MYTIISGTNRPGSHTLKVAKEYQRLLKGKNIEAPIFSLENFNPLIRTEQFIQVENEILIPAQKFIFIVPEYNGSYPGVLKSLIDNSDIRKAWYYKKALLTGVATGRAGNLRGMDHLADTLHYLRMNIFYNKLPISTIDKLLNKEAQLQLETVEVINEQLDGFLKY